MQAQMASFKKSQDDVDDALKGSRILSAKVDERIVEAERRLSLSENAVSKMQGLLDASRRNTFQEGGDEHAKWSKLRFKMAKKKSKAELKAEVDAVTKRLEKIGNSE